MPSALQWSAHIFEDPPAVNISGLSHSTTVKSDFFEGGRHRSPAKTQTASQYGNMSPSPLGERHINSPPQTRKVPLSKDDSHRPPMHKKSSSSNSLKALLKGRERTSDDITATVTSGSPSKKTKSSTNLGGLLKKKSKKDLLDNAKDTVDHTRGPANINGEPDQGLPLEPPRRPFLEHKSSRSSIFTEELDGGGNSAEHQRPLIFEKCPTDSRSKRLSLAESSRCETQSDLPKTANETAKRSSKIFNTIAALNMRPRREDHTAPQSEEKLTLNAQELDNAMEKMLGRYDIPKNLHDQLRNLKPEVKAGLMKGDRICGGSSEPSSKKSDENVSREGRRLINTEEAGKDEKRSQSRSRTRNRILSLSRRGDSSPSKGDVRNRSSSKSRPKSVDMSWSSSSKGISSTVSLATTNTSNSTVTPGDFIHYLSEVQRPGLVEVGKIHKLRILLRNESVAWTDAFVKKGGMDEIVQLLYRIMEIEWREEHEDNLLHETLLCLKGLSTTKLAMQRLEDIGVELFPALLKMLFDPERKGPAEYGTRGIIISLIFSHLSATLHCNLLEHEHRARYILSMMRDPKPVDDRQPLDFVSQMHISRPYRTWCKEVTNVTKEVFWIFLHHMNVVPISASANANEIEYTRAYFPSLRAPHPAAPYVGGVEWEATQYLALHLDLLNGLIVSLPNTKERNILREELKQSGWEKVMGASLRTCKEKFYGGVHDGLRSWVAAAKIDGWMVEDVRAGPPREPTSPKKSPTKKNKQNEAPKISLDVGGPLPTSNDNEWL